MILPPAALCGYNFFEPPPIRVEASDAPHPFDASLLPPRQFERIGLTTQLAAVLDTIVLLRARGLRASV